ncbi:hypothetical protein NPX79_03680 [Spiroplasma endosymbiont of Anurida maritima]|uniref:hypothetical protein n=1 Tax=Spiroplasma endosymbiont of Anurida maritima TaxID=2967972 RepID=UPI0036D21802
MKQNMFVFSIEDFLKLEANAEMLDEHSHASHQFDFASWKALTFSSSKIKFIIRYLQGVFKWLSEVVDTNNLKVMISAFVVDKFNFRVLSGETTLFHCNLATNFFVVKEEEWSDKIDERHFTNFDYDNGSISVNKEELNIWKDEEGFSKFINVLLVLIKDFKNINKKLLPVIWTIEFIDSKFSNSRLRMQINRLKTRPDDKVDYVSNIQKLIHNNYEAIKGEDDGTKDVEDLSNISEGIDVNKRPSLDNDDSQDLDKFVHKK